MKINIFSVVFILVIMTALPSCVHFHDDDVSVSISEDEDEFEMDADYRKNQSNKVQVYLNDHLLNGRVKVKRGHINREITLDDNTSFYVNADPGRLYIKIDKDENSAASLERIKLVCEDLKIILAEQ